MEPCSMAGSQPVTLSPRGCPVPFASAGNSFGPCRGMVGKELDTDSVEFRFPNVRKTFWRSATWNSHSVPSSPKIPARSTNTAVEECSSSSSTDAKPTHEHNQSTRSRIALPPLQPLSIARKSLDDWPSAGLDDTGDWAPSTPGRRRVKNGPDIKLDLASLQRSNVEPTEIQLKRDKFAHFDKQCSRVGNYHIYLGSDVVARDREILRTNGITHVLNCVGFVCSEYFKTELVYKTLWLQDTPCEDITSLLYDVFDYFEEVREQDGRVFVHCCQGVSRSTSLVIAYLMWREHSTFEDAFQRVKAARGVTNPNMGFACQLLQCQKRVHAAPMSPDSTLRMYRIVPHSPYDALHLVPKAINNPGAGSLDSRGAFVIHVPYAIMVWIGKDCDLQMAQAAKGAAGQLVRYERADVPIQVIAEGDEGPEFWDSLLTCSAFKDESNRKVVHCSVTEGTCDSSQESTIETQKNINKTEVERVRLLGSGNRKVSSNDTDYSVYITARQGGVIPPVPFTGVGVTSTSTQVPERENGWSLLRRKFLLGEILPNKGKEKTTAELSPNTSMGSSSPHLSPVSASSTPSLVSSSDSPFGSPISSGNVSPDLVQKNLSLGSSYQSQPILNRLSIPQSSQNKSTSSTLGQRRGIAPALRLPGLEDDPPTVARVMSGKSKLPPLVTTEKDKDEKNEDEDEESNFSFEAVGEVCDGLVSDYHDLPTSRRRSNEVDTDYQDLPTSRKTSNESGTDYPDLLASRRSFELDSDYPLPTSRRSNADTDFTPLTTSRVVHFERSDSPLKEDGCASELYSWPELETIGMFDVDDLDPKSAFVLTKKWNDQFMGIYVWVGRQVSVDDGDDNETVDSEEDDFWYKVGHDFVVQKKLPNNIPIKVVREGDEPEEFWDVFNHS